IGVPLSDQDFNRELNTVMHDAVHRAVTGKSTEPSGEGFAPHPHAVPLSTAMDVLREEGQKLGLGHPHALMNKSEPVIFSPQGIQAVADQNKEYTPEEAAEVLKKAVKEKISSFEADLRELRARELKKGLIPPHKHNTGLTVSAGVEDVAGAKMKKTSIPSLPLAPVKENWTTGSVSEVPGIPTHGKLPPGGTQHVADVGQISSHGKLATGQGEQVAVNPIAPQGGLGKGSLKTHGCAG